MNQELSKKKKINDKSLYRKIETLILRIRYNWKTYIIRIIIGLVPVIPLIMFAKKFDKIEILKDFINAFSYDISGYNISLIHMLVYVLTTAFIIAIINLVFRNNYECNYDVKIRNALIKKDENREDE